MTSLMQVCLCDLGATPKTIKRVFFPHWKSWTGFPVSFGLLQSHVAVINPPQTWNKHSWKMFGQPPYLLFSSSHKLIFSLCGCLLLLCAESHYFHFLPLGSRGGKKCTVNDILSSVLFLAKAQTYLNISNVNSSTMHCFEQIFDPKVGANVRVNVTTGWQDLGYSSGKLHMYSLEKQWSSNQ